MLPVLWSQLSPLWLRSKPSSMAQLYFKRSCHLGPQCGAARPNHPHQRLRQVPMMFPCGWTTSSSSVSSDHHRNYIRFSSTISRHSSTCLTNKNWTSRAAPHSVSLQVGQDQMTLETGQYARFADGCAVCRAGDTAALVTVVSTQPSLAAPGTFQASDFVPLIVDYRLKGAAAGRIPTNYLRRDLAPSDEELLVSRMIDRSIRPLFFGPDGEQPGYKAVQVTCNLLCMDGVTDPAVLSLNGASAALALSGIPWAGPVGAVRLGLSADRSEIIVSPTRLQLQRSPLDLVLVSRADGSILMIEMGGDGVSENDMKRALQEGLRHTQRIAHSIVDLVASAGKPKWSSAAVQPGNWSQCAATDAAAHIAVRNDVDKKEETQEQQQQQSLSSDEVLQKMRHLCEADIRSVFSDSSHDKISRDTATDDIATRAMEKLQEEGVFEADPVLKKVASSHFSALRKEIFRKLIFERGLRCDGRQLDELRPISCSVDLYKPLHGSSIFQRGQSQVLTTLTFDSKDSAFRANPLTALMSSSAVKPFMLHYEFPQFAVNRIATAAGQKKRRELGHGALAERALRPIVASVGDFPFTIRLSCEVLESNGSTSMGSVCGGSLALMDAGVPIAGHVSGISIGLITRTDYNADGFDSKQSSSGFPEYRILTDLLGIEDYMGDMDFKMASGPQGWNAVQLDLKIPGVPLAIILEAFEAGKVANDNILSRMNRVISEPRLTPKANAPVTEELIVPAYKRGRFLGLGGCNLRRIESEIGVTISAVDDIKFLVFAPNRDAMIEAKEALESLLQESEVEPEMEFGHIYTGRVVEILDAGVMLQILPGARPVLLPNAQLDSRPVRHASALEILVGQELTIRCFGRDPISGRWRISRKVLQSAAALPKKVGVKRTAGRTHDGVKSSPWVSK